MGDNGFRDRAETAAMPHQNRSLRPGGMQRGMNFGRVVCATQRQRSDGAARMGVEHSARMSAVLPVLVPGISPVDVVRTAPFVEEERTRGAEFVSLSRKR